MDARDIESLVFKALSVAARRELLDAVARQGPIDLKSLVETTDLKEPTVRHHLQALERAGLVRVEEDHQGSRGRPRLLYSRTDEHWNLGQPVRQYKLLAEHLLDHIIAHEGRRGAAEAFREIGRGVGAGILQAAGVEPGEDPGDVNEVFEKIGPLLDEFGSLVKIVTGREGEVIVEMRNCIFFELAEQHHDIVCQGHAAIFAHIAQRLGDYEVESRTCLAKGDGRCVTCIRKRG